MLFIWQLPEEARELDKELRQIVKEKTDAVSGQDFEKVVNVLFLKQQLQIFRNTLFSIS